MAARPLSAVDAISPAFEHTRAQLLPLRLGQWARLAILGLATGEMSSSGGCNGAPNFNIPTTTSRPEREFLSVPILDPHSLAAIIFWAALLALSATVLVLILVYVSSVCRFILFESVLTKHCSLRRGWRRWQPQGWRFFGWQLLMSAILLLGFGILLGVPAAVGFGTGIFREPSQHIGLLIAAGAIVLLLMVAFGATMLLVIVFTKDFVVPQMALENIGVIEGWRRLRAMIRAETGRYAAYAGMKVLLALAATVIVGIAVFIIALVLLIPGIALGIFVFAVVKGIGLHWTLTTIALAVILGTLLFMALMFLIALVAAPVTVFFPAYSMYFLAGRYPPLAARLLPEPPAPPMPPPEAAPA